MRKNRVVAAMIAIFGGIFGLHKFYLGDTGGGIFFIFLFFMVSSFFHLTLLLGLLEGVRLLTMNDDAFDRQYNRNVLRQQRVPGSVEDRRYKQMQRAKHKNIPDDAKRQRKSTSSGSSRSNPFKKSGIKKHKDFDLEAAIEDFKQGLELSPNDVALHYNIACSYSMTEQKELGFYHLTKAVELGFNDFEKLQTQDDLAFLRIQPEFEAFKASGYRNNPISRTNTSTQNDTTEAMEAPVKDDKLLSQLNRLAELRNRGLLTEDEFAVERRKLMHRG